MRPRRRPWRWRPSAPDGHRRSPAPPRARSPALGTLPRHRPRLSPLPRPRLSPRAYQRPQGIAHTGMGNARLQGQQSQGRTAEGMAIFGGRPAVSIPPSGGGGPPQRAFAGAIGTKGHSPPLNARYGHPRATSIDWGIDQPPGYEGKKHRPLHRAASVWAKRRFAAGTIDSRFSQRTGPATATA